MANNVKKLLVIFGTRPEAIKLGVLISRLQLKFDVHICFTGQHDELVSETLKELGIRPDYKLGVLKKGQSLSKLTSRLIENIEPIFEQNTFDAVVVQGDTTSVFAGALVANYFHTAVFHVEAGLRTYERHSPFPEEMNRVITTMLSSLHFAPTLRNRANLIKEGVPKQNIIVTGNTGIDTLVSVSRQLEGRLLDKKIISILPFLKGLDGNKIVLITCHRRENLGASIHKISEAIKRLAMNFADFYFVLSLHLNPLVKDHFSSELSNKKNIYIINPMSYKLFVRLMMNSKIILTDSGGLQEEAPSLNIPVVVMRNSTERQEAVDAGCAILSGTSTEGIYSAVSKLLSDENYYNQIAANKNPYGDGTASQKIIAAIDRFFK